MKKIRAAIVGYGNIGRYVLEALQQAPDFEVAGVVRRNPSNVPAELAGSIVRALMQAAAPKGVTYTNFGPGMSMGHTVAVKSKPGVKNALSMTIPLGTGIHRRMVYVEVEDGYTIDQIAKSVKEDPYFASDETHVFQVPSVDEIKDMGHGVNMVRKGVSGVTQNQRFEFNMSINNPALTAQILVGVARATMIERPGAYTMIEIPVIDMLYGDREELIRHLV